MSWSTHNISRSNDFMTGGAGSGVLMARSLQQKQWRNVLLQVHTFMGKPAVRQAYSVVREYEYDDYNNRIGAEEKDESFVENLLYLFK